MNKTIQRKSRQAAILLVALLISFSVNARQVKPKKQKSTVCVPVFAQNPTGKIPEGMIYINSSDGTLRYFDGKQFVACVQTFFTPTAGNVVVAGNAQPGHTVSGQYQWQSNTETEGKSTCQWYYTDNPNGATKKAIPEATEKTYTISAPVTAGMFVAFGITPVNANNNKGAELLSKWIAITEN